MSYDPRRRSTWRHTKRAQKFEPKILEKGISTEYSTGCRWIVYKDAQRIGHILEKPQGFVFEPLGEEPGESFPTFMACRRSLERAANSA